MKSLRARRPGAIVVATMNQPHPETPGAPRPPWWLVALLPALLVVAGVLWHLGHPAPVLSGHNLPLVAVAQLRAFDADPIDQLGTLHNGDLPPRYSLFNLTARVTAALFGRNHLGLVLASTLYLLALGGAVFWLTNRLAGRTAGFAAMAFAMLTPAALGWSKVLAPNIAVLAWPALGVCLLVASDWLRRPIPALAFAAMAAVAPVVGESASDAAQMLLVFSVTAAYALVLRLAILREHRLRALLTVVSMAVVVAALLNTVYVKAQLIYLQQESIALAGAKYAGGDLRNSPAALLAYPALLWGHHLWPAFCLIALGALGLNLRRLDRATGLALLWFFVPLLAVTLTPKKDYDYILAALPGVAVLVGLAVARLPKPSHVRLALAAVLVAGLANLAWSMARPSPPPETWSPLITKHVHVGGEYLQLPAWGAGADTVTIARRAAAATPPEARLLFLARLDSFDAVTMRYYLRLAEWRGDIRLSDPVLAAENGTIAANLEGIAEGRESVGVALVLPDERGLLHDRNFTTADSFREYFTLRRAVAGAYPDPKDRERMATFFAQTLAAIDWDAFERSDWLGRGISPRGRLRVEMYTDPDLAGRIDLPPEPNLFAGPPN
jgi:hypothetical protein